MTGRFLKIKRAAVLQPVKNIEKKLCSFDAVFFLKFLYATCRIDNFLFAGKKRMAFGTNFKLYTAYS